MDQLTHSACRVGYFACMADTSWVDVAGLITGSVGAATGIAALMLSLRSTTASEDSAVSARLSAEASKEAAAAAHASVGEATELNRIERNRDHMQLGPPRPTSLPIKIEQDERLGGGHRNVWSQFTLPRPYRVKAWAFSRASSHPLSIDLLVRAGQVRFFLEDWPPDRKNEDGLKTDRVVVHFWCPAEVDDVEHWTCPCGRPEEGDGSGPGHWEWQVSLDPPPPSGGVRRAG
ncbi:hypothetical protein ACIA8K_29745 [Catenuloplanes sp. NPDC051500]|uniref:hypothetical protein n=1 Tax=Catenuloplanes sp. NPDC051500 TaxID=3363959 RepID=UPI0037AE222B